MRLTRIDRLERIENILQRKILNAENELESLGNMKDAEICRLRIMYQLDLQKMRLMLIELRRKLDLEYAIKGIRRDFHDEIRCFKQGVHMDTGYEADLQRGTAEADSCAGCGSGFYPVGRDGADLPGNDEGRPIRGWQIGVMMRDAKRAAEVKVNEG